MAVSVDPEPHGGFMEAAILCPEINCMVLRRREKMTVNVART